LKKHYREIKNIDQKMATDLVRISASDIMTKSIQKNLFQSDADGTSNTSKSMNQYSIKNMRSYQLVPIELSPRRQKDVEASPCRQVISDLVFADGAVMVSRYRRNSVQFQKDSFLCKQASQHRGSIMNGRMKPMHQSAFTTAQLNENIWLRLCLHSAFFPMDELRRQTR
jgi:hypothetical protein